MKHTITFESLSPSDAEFVRRLAPVSSQFATGIYTAEGLQELALLWNTWWTHFEEIFEQKDRQGLLNERDSLKKNTAEISQLEGSLTAKANALRKQRWQGMERDQYELKDRQIRIKLLELEDRKQHLWSQRQLLENVLYRWDHFGDTKRPDFLLTKKKSPKTERLQAVLTVLDAFVLYEELNKSRRPRSRNQFGRFIENRFQIDIAGKSILKSAERALIDIGGRYNKWDDYDSYKQLFVKYTDDFLKEAAIKKATAFGRKSKSE